MIQPATQRRRTRRIRSYSFGGRTAAPYRPRIERLEGRALLASSPLLSLSFPGSAGGALTVESFAFAGSNPDTGGLGTGGAASKAAPGPLTLVLPGSTADPTLLADMVAGHHLATAQVQARTSSTAAPYLTFTLSDVLVGSIKTAIASGGQPVTTITLDWATLSESFTPALPNGSPGQPVVSTWDAIHNTATGAGTPATTATGVPALALSFGGAGSLAVESFAFAGSNPPSPSPTGGAASKAAPGPLTLVLPGSAADPTLLADMVVGQHLATVAVRASTTGLKPAVYLTYTLSDVLVGSVQTSIASGGRPVTTVTLNWSTLSESYAPTQSDGTLGAPVVATWDVAHSIVGGAGTPAAPAAAPPLGLSFGGAGELAVESFAFAGSNPPIPNPTGGAGGAGKAAPGPLTLVLDGSAADPTLLADMVASHHLPTVAVRARTVGPGPAVYLTYTLSDVLVGSIQTAIADGQQPVTTITLDWSTISESYAPRQTDGTLGAPVVSTWDAIHNTATGAGTPATTATGVPALALSFGGAGSLAVQSFAFAGSNPGNAVTGTGAGAASIATPGPLTLVLPGSTADPTLLADMVADRHLATVAVRASTTGLKPAVYLTYTLSDVLIDSVQTAIASGGQPVTTVTLDWATLSESFTPALPNGSPGQPVVSTWDAIHSTATGAGTPATTSTGVAPPLALSFGGTGSLDVQSFAFAGSNPDTAVTGTGAATSKATPGPLTLVLEGSAADPTLLADMVAGHHLPTVVVRASTTGLKPVVYLTYTLSDVLVGSVQTSIASGGQPVTTITLDWSTLSVSYATIGPTGTAGAPVVATWDAARDIGGGAGTPAAPAATPPLGLSFGGAGELSVESFSFAGSNPPTVGAPGGGAAAGRATPGPLTLVLDGSAADPTLLADMVAGHHLPTVVVRARTVGPKPAVYLTYTLSDVLVGSVQTSITDGGKPVTTITLNWSTLSESYAPTQSDGTLGAPVVGSWDAITDTATGVGTPGVGNPADATSEFTLTQGGFRFNRATQQFAQTITISYLGSTPIVGSSMLSLDGLIGGTLAGASTTAGALAINGGLSVLLPSIGVGQSLTITLLFTDPSQGPISYTPHILIG